MSLAKDIFLAPGRVITWWAYMFPQRGQLWASARRKDNALIHVMFSAAFWAALTFFLWTAVVGAVGGGSRKQQVAESGSSESVVPTPAPIDVRATSATLTQETATSPTTEGQEAEGTDSGRDEALRRPTPSVSDGLLDDPSLLRAIRSTLETGEAAQWRSETRGVQGYAVASAPQVTDQVTCRNVIYTVRSRSSETRSNESAYCRSAGASEWATK
jgi:hypothetical protein